MESLQSMMLWFLESPAGLKLNHELGSFLSELFLWLIRLWTGRKLICGALISMSEKKEMKRDKKKNELVDIKTLTFFFLYT